jgi:hypothetical protein
MPRWNLVAISTLAASFACSGNKDDDSGTGPGPGGGNNRPVADAGDDAAVPAGQVVPLQGCGSYDPDGDQITFAWSFDHVPNGSLLGNPDKNPFPENYTTSCDTSFIPDTVGTYVVKVVVSDNRGAVSAPDYAVITVEGGSKPIANAGVNQSGPIGTTFTLDGTGSSDSTDRPLTYAWAMTNKPAGSAAALTDETTIAPTFTADVAGLYTVALVVDNGVLLSEPDTVNVTATIVDPQAPIADAGADVTGEDCTAIPLNGSASSDPDGSALVYSWALQTKPANSRATNDAIANRGAVITTFYPDVAGDYTVSLAVYDGKSWSVPDVMAIHVIERLDNNLPLVYAGADTLFKAGTAVCEDGEYGPDCDDCGSYTTLLGSDATITDPDSDPMTTLWELVSGEAEIDDPLLLITSVDMESPTPEDIGDCAEAEVTFQLNATDCPEGTAGDQVTYTVQCCGVAAP